MSQFNDSQPPPSVPDNVSPENTFLENDNDNFSKTSPVEISPPAQGFDQSSHLTEINGHPLSFHKEFTQETQSPSPQDSPILNNNPDQYLGNNFFSDEKPGQNNDGLFDLTPDQQQAFRELELRKQQADYDDDYEFGLKYDQIPEYDVREKLQSLNAQLANEPLPPDAEHRNSKVVFRDEIVSLVAPAEDYDQSESEPDESSSKNNTREADDDSSQKVSPFEVEQMQPTHEENASIEAPIAKEDEYYRTSKESDQEVSLNLVKKDEEISEGDKENEDMVVSRGGKFQLLGAHDITDGSKSANERENDEGEIKPSRMRPTSAPASKRHLRDNLSNTNSAGSTKSDANSRPNSLFQRTNEKSKLQIPRVDKEALRRQQERKKKEEEENTRREEEEQKMRKEMNSKSFNAWLLTKQKSRKEEEERKKKEEDDEKEKKEKLQDERKAIAEEKERELSKKLENDRRKDEKLRQYRLKEIEDCMTVHSKAECRKAFKDWLKKKQRDHQNKLKEERQKARITRLAMRQCRKSQDLAQAIHQSNSFRYLDFCGYP